MINVLNTNLIYQDQKIQYDAVDCSICKSTHKTFIYKIRQNKIIKKFNAEQKMNDFEIIKFAIIV